MTLQSVLVIAVLASAFGLAGTETAPKEFDEHLREYVKVRDHAAQGLPEAKKKSDNPAVFKEGQAALAHAIQAERRDAKRGDIFTPEVSRYLLGILRPEAKGAATRRATEDGNPVEEGVPVQVGVNKRYTEGAPLSTVPPSILLKLPKLPKDLEYRFVGKSMILYDALSGLIIDYIPNAI